MKKLLQTLTETLGPSGYEDKIREIVRREVKPLADEIRVDTLGNLIVRKCPNKPAQAAKKIMVAAHMDEMGVIASHVDKNGFVRFSPVGPLVGGYLPGGRVRFLNGTQGVIGFEGLDHGSELPALDKAYIDVGAASREDCPVKIGDVAAFDCPYAEFGNRLTAKAMDNRAGVLAAMESLRALKSTPHDVYFVFTTQSQVGTRGAVTSAYGVDPDIGIALEATAAEDTPHAHGMGMALGQGPCIRIQDGGMIADARLVSWMIAAAERSKVPYQREVIRQGGSDARAIQIARAGVPAGCISIPVRYLHSPSEMVDYSDVQNTVRLLAAVLRIPIDL